MSNKKFLEFLIEISKIFCSIDDRNIAFDEDIN